MRNEESHFSINPTDLDIGRSRFPRPFDHKTTFNVGELIPFYWSEILPGDTVEMKTSKVVRLSTLLDPVMDNLYLDCYYFFVPMRLVWEHTREFLVKTLPAPGLLLLRIRSLRLRPLIIFSLLLLSLVLLLTIWVFLLVFMVFLLMLSRFEPILKFIWIGSLIR